MASIYSEKLFARFAPLFRAHLRTVGLDESVFTRPDSEIPIHKYMALLDQVAEHDEPGIGLRMGRELDPKDLGVLGHAMLAAADIGSLLKTLCCYIYVFAQDNTFRLDLSREYAVVSYRCLVPGAIALHRDIEFALAGIARCISVAAGRPIAPAHAEFEHPRPRYAKEYQAAFGCPVRFEQRGNRLHYAKKVLALPVVSHDARLFEALEFFLIDKLKTRGQDDELLRKLKHLVTSMLHDGVPELSTVAAKIGMSERTLQRRLTEQGAVFSELVDETRKSIALEYIRDTDYRLVDIAQILGYGESSSLTRAFKRWTGKSPREVRRQP